MLAYFVGLTAALYGPMVGAADVNAVEELRRTSVFVEGEDFTPVGPGWRSGDGWDDDIYEATSNDAVLSNDGGGGEARYEVTVPAAGAYCAWLRYLKIGTYPGVLGLRIEQGGATVLDGRYRTQPEGADWRAVWEKQEATLETGPATLTLYIAEPGIRQHVDCVLLTRDTDYQPDFHDFARRVYLRVRLLDPPQPTTVRVATYQHRAPNWYGDAGVLTSAGLDPAGPPLGPEVWSPWCDISRYMDGGKRLTTVKLRFLSDGQPVARVHAEVQVAGEPDEAETLAFDENTDGEIVALQLPGDVRRYPESALLITELSKRHLATAQGLGLPEPSATDGPIPLEVGIWGWGDSYRSLETLRTEMSAARLLGANTLNDFIGARRALAAEVGFSRNFLSQWLPYQAWNCPTDPGLPAMMDAHFARIAEDIRKEDPNALASVARNILWDEPGTSDLAHIQGCPSCTAAFRTFLQDRGLHPEDFGRASWDEVAPIQRDAATDAPKRKLHYWSVEFRDLSNAQLVRLASEASQRHLGDQILTSVNFTDGALSGWEGALANGPDWFLYGRIGATSLLWSEDWASLGPEVSGYIADMLRAAARPSGLPTGEYIICNHVPTLEQRAFSALMHGARTLHFYCYGPYYAFADGMVSDSPETQRALGLTLRHIAAAAPYIAPATLPPAEVAILYGKSHEIWQSDAAVGTERRTMYLAMQQAHVPVDILSERDIDEGLLKGYRMLVATESNVRRDAAEAIAEWVRDGGVLWMSAGAGVRDEYDEPSTVLCDLAGVAIDGTTKPPGDYREHYGIPATAPRGELALPAGEFWGECRLPLLGYQDKARSVGAHVIATFDDGSPAAFHNAAGRGQVLRFAFMPGLGYVKSADPGPNRLTVGYRREQLELLCAGIRLARIESPLVIDEPLVEAQLLTGPDAGVVVLVNWAGRDLPSLRVELLDGRAYSRAESLTQGERPLERAGDRAAFTVDLGVTDVVVLRR